MFFLFRKKDYFVCVFKFEQIKSSNRTRQYQFLTRTDRWHCRITSVYLHVVNKTFVVRYEVCSGSITITSIKILKCPSNILVILSINILSVARMLGYKQSEILSKIDFKIVCNFRYIDKRTTYQIVGILKFKQNSLT